MTFISVETGLKFRVLQKFNRNCIIVWVVLKINAFPHSSPEGSEMVFPSISSH